MPSEMVICYEINVKVNRDTHKLHVKSAEPPKFLKEKVFDCMYFLMKYDPYEMEQNYEL